jgi:hypothetical protein
MKMQKKRFMASVLALALALSFVSAWPDTVQTQALAQEAEAQAVGGYSCATIWGFGLALGIASLSPCGIMCGTAAWYTIMLLNQC